MRLNSDERLVLEGLLTNRMEFLSDEDLGWIRWGLHYGWEYHQEILIPDSVGNPEKLRKAVSRAQHYDKYRELLNQPGTRVILVREEVGA